MLPNDLLQFQQYGAYWLSQRPRALLADEMGLGKTIQAIRGADLIEAKRVLVLCPSIARFNWAAEIKEWAWMERTTQVILTQASEPLPIAKLAVITSYDLASNPKLKHKLMEQSWDLIICDESHYLKSRQTARTRAVFGYSRNVQGLVSKAKYLWCLSGTPAPNNYGELYPMLKAFGAWKQDYWAFLDRYTHWYDGPFGVQIKKGKNQPELKETLAPFMLRRKKEDVLPQLPKITFETVVVEPGLINEEIWFPNSVGQKDKELPRKLDEQRKVLEVLDQTVGMHVEEGIDAIRAAEKSLSTIRKWNGMQKIDAVAEMAAGALETGALEKLVIFCVHRDVVIELSRRLEKYSAITLFGGTPPKKRESHIHRFQNNPKYKVIICNIQAAGTAVTLTAAHHIWFIEQDWVPANNAQAVMRCNRIGQTKPVFAKFFGVVGSIDAKIAATLKRKTADLAELFA